MYLEVVVSCTFRMRRALCIRPVRAPCIRPASGRSSGFLLYGPRFLICDELDVVKYVVRVGGAAVRTTTSLVSRR